MDRYAVLGNPIEHSRSPEIHRHFAIQTGQVLTYERILVPLDRLAAALDAFERAGGRGANVTLPFKIEALARMDQLSPRAARSGAVNTIVFQPDGRLGDNTDGIGLLRDLDHHGITLKGRRMLLLGAGGAVRGVLQALLESGPLKVVLANRTLEHAQALAEDFADLADIEACGFADLEGVHFDVVINGTSASVAGELPPLPDGILSQDACCYDLYYADHPTVFLHWARAQGAACLLDGLGMLVEQAAESFYLWRGVRPDTRRVLRALR